MSDQSKTTDDRPGPGWGNICRDCFGCKIEWPGVRRCECTVGKIVLPKAGWWREDEKNA